MKSFMVSALFLGLALFSQASIAANNNPQMRVCWVNGGEFLVLNAGQENENPFCTFGSAIIGSQTLIDQLWEGKSTKAVVAFEATLHNSPGACELFGGVRTSGLVGSAPVDICVFDDASQIGLETLTLGNLDEANRTLSSLLGLL